MGWEPRRERRCQRRRRAAVIVPEEDIRVAAVGQEWLEAGRPGI
jgi:hypothetical protein